MFVSKPSFYNRTRTESEGIKAIPALITDPDGGTETGTAVFANNKLLCTLTEAGAWKLANDIADAIETNRRNAA
ncbi:hypothetical protein GCM10009696_32670 [Kocuria himachalensis]